MALSATLSTKYQISIPKAIREEQHWKAGQKFVFIPKAREASEDESDQVIAFTQQCVVAPLDTRIALHAADLHRQYKLATADAIVYATAVECGADLLTCDARFEKLPGVLLVRKRS